LNDLVKTVQHLRRQVTYLPETVRQHVNVPLFRNAYLLMLNAAATSGLGFLYWVVAARLYETEVVGVSSAALSVINFLGGVAQLSLHETLTRFVPPAGRAIYRIVAVAYLVSAVVGLVAAVVFLAGLDFWTPTLSFLKDSSVITWLFVLSTVISPIFTLQDSTMTGLRQPKLILIENVVFGCLKLVMLVVLMDRLRDYGIFASSVVPMMLLVIPVNILIFAHLIRKHIAATPVVAQPTAVREIVRYASSNYVGFLASLITFTLLPVIVVNVAGKAAGAHFYLPWMLATSLRLIVINMTSSLTVEAALDEARLTEYCARILKNTLRIVGGLALLTALAAPVVLQLFGPQYAAAGAPLLRWLAAAAVPNVVIMTYFSMANVQKKLKHKLIVMVILSVAEMTASYFLLARFGTSGVGIALFACQTLVASFLLATSLRPVIQHLTHVQTHQHTPHHTMPKDIAVGNAIAVGNGAAIHNGAAQANTIATVSIIINNYNYSQYVGTAIKSALAQSHPAIEIIVVDDGSSDNSRAAIEEFGTSVKPIFKTNGGQASAFNTGFAASRGDVVIFLDADDVLLPHAAAHAAEHFSKHPHTAKLMMQMEVISGDGSRTGIIKPFDHLTPPTGDLACAVVRHPGDAMWLPTSGNAFSARHLRAVLPMPEAPFRTCADFYVCHTVLLYGHAAFLPEVCALYRVHGKNNFDVNAFNMRHLQQSIAVWQSVYVQLDQHAQKLNLSYRPAAISNYGSVSDLGNRLISLKLDRQQHPVATDNVWHLFRRGIGKALEHSELHCVLRLFYVLWFCAILIAPKRGAWWLAEQWVFPGKRRDLINDLLSRLHGHK
jgi:glycosyltransferase involved in cell wall biosynthesis/O-antigen/teichoic acid export membrane protein